MRDLRRSSRNVWQSLVMLICDCKAEEVVHDAICDGTTAHMIIQCPMCEESALIELQVTSVRRWSDEDDEWSDKEKIAIN